jgi:hypothetical protein
VLGEKLTNYLPERVLPISTEPPKDLHTMVETDFQLIKDLVKPHTRKHMEAKAKLKALAIVESSLEGIRSQPSDLEVKKLVKDVQAGNEWKDMFPGIASLHLSSTGTGINVDIRITKKEGEAVRLVPEGTPGATVLAVKRVNELDYYSLSPTKFAEKLGLTQPKALALAKHLKLHESEDYFKVIKIGKSPFNRYSGRALEIAREELKEADMNEIWREHRPRRQ